MPPTLPPLQERVLQDLWVTFSFPVSSSSVSQKLETSSLTPPSLQPPGLPKPPALSAQPPVTCFCILPGCQGSSAGLHLLNPIPKQTPSQSVSLIMMHKQQENKYVFFILSSREHINRETH